MMDFREVAENLIYKGASVVPVIDKRPYISKWSELRGEQLLEDIYTIQWKKANGIGLLCGKASGIICLDIDILKNNEKLKPVRDQLEKLLPPIMCGLVGNPDKPVARFFKYNGEIAQKFKNIDVEILSDGNQKVIPPSKHPAGKTYQWVGQSLSNIDLDDLPDMPEYILNFLTETNESHSKQKSLTKTHKTDLSITQMPGRCASGSHNHISALAVRLFHQHCPIDTIIEKLLSMDQSINKNSHSLYFECKSRPWKTSDINVNVASFVDEVKNRNLNKRDETKTDMAIIHDEGLMRSKGANGTPGAVINNLYNVKYLIAQNKGLAGNLWYDNFHYKFMGKKASGEVIEWQDEDDYDLTMYLQKSLNLGSLKDDMVRKARISHSMQHIKCEPKDWMETLSWDGQKRISSFFHTYMGCEDGEYTQAVSTNFWISMTARVYSPGCKADNMVILEGEQGSHKSSALGIIGGPWYVESNETLGSKDFCQITQGNLIIEIAELDSFSRSESNTIKKVISTAVDRYRAPYARNAKDYPRQCIFVGTTNDDDYLKDATGGRRFWPIACGRIDLDKIKEDRTQLFAEAVEMYKNGAKWWVVPKIAKILQESRTEEDPWTTSIENFLNEKMSLNVKYISVPEILSKCIKIDIDKMNRVHSNRVTRILKLLKWDKKKSIRMDGKVVKGYFKA